MAGRTTPEARPATFRHLHDRAGIAERAGAIAASAAVATTKDKHALMMNVLIMMHLLFAFEPSPNCVATFGTRLAATLSFGPGKAMATPWRAAHRLEG
jgi:hypothetical protein